MLRVWTSSASAPCCWACSQRAATAESCKNQQQSSAEPFSLTGGKGTQRCLHRSCCGALARPPPLYLHCCTQILSKAAKEGLHAAEMLRKCREAVKLGRMSGPFQPQELDLDTVVLSTRFGVSQGVTGWRVLQGGFRQCRKPPKACHHSLPLLFCQVSVTAWRRSEGSTT